MIKEPIFFERNRVRRVYTGGKLFGKFFGDKPEDGFYPEEWIASNVRALNKEIESERDGVSRTESGRWFDEVLEKNPQEMLGKGKKMRILVKALDSAVRLPAQAHPDKAYSRKYFNSEYGKTECWVILDTREDALLYFGFKDGVDKEQFSKAIEGSRYSPDAMEKLMCRIKPKKGDVFLVPAKTVHAIGAGCLILEIQEPTDFTIQPEHKCGDYELNNDEMCMGLNLEQALECFEFGTAQEAKIQPRTIIDKDGVRVEKLIDMENTDCFCINRITLENSEYVLFVKDSFGIYIVTEGSGRLTGADYERDVKKGDYFFMPASLMGQVRVCGDMEIIECF